MSGDIERMALALRGGDLTAAVPLLDALRECGDARRAERLHYAVGTLLSRMDEIGMSRFAAVDFRREVDRLFWTEVRRDDLAFLSVHLSSTLGVAETDARQSTRLADEEGLPLEAVMRTPTHLPDEDGNELDLTDMTTVMAALRSGFVASLPSDPGGDSEGGEP